jgi:hypothetical protein
MFVFSQVECVHGQQMAHLFDPLEKLLQIVHVYLERFGSRVIFAYGSFAEM